MKSFPPFFVKGSQTLSAGAAQRVHGRAILVDGGNMGRPLRMARQRPVFQAEKKHSQRKPQKAGQNRRALSAQPAVAQQQAGQKQSQRDGVGQRRGMEKTPVGQLHLHPVANTAGFGGFQTDDGFLRLAAAGSAFGAGLRAGITDDGHAALGVVADHFAEFGHVRPPLSI